MISIVVPIYNEEEILQQLFDRLNSAAPSWNIDYEIILVDDGSKDNSYEIMRGFSDKNDHFKVLKLSRNFGHQAAISAGIKASSGDAVILMDGDLQDPPEVLPKFIAKWKEGYHVVYAIRQKRKENLLKRAAYKSFYRLLGVLGDIEIPLDSGDFCLMDRKVVDVLNNDIKEQNRFVRGLRAYAGFNQIGLKYDRDERAGGEVKYTVKKLMKLALDGLFDFSTFPLRLATYLGFLIAIPSFLAGVFFIVHRIFDFKVLGYSPSDTPGLASLAVGMFFLGGITLIILGIIGEYIGRIYFEVKKRPSYIVEEFYSKSHKDVSN